MVGDSLQEMMRNYFDSAEHEVSGCSIPSVYEIPPLSIQELPVATHRSSWEVVESPRRLMKTFGFDNKKLKKSFVIELLEYEEEVNHYAKITVNAETVIIEVYTHDVDDVTELDKEYAVAADDIYQDIKHYDPHVELEFGQYFET